MFNCKPSALNEDLTKLIEAQAHLLQLYREGNKETQELLDQYRKLVKNQETEIENLKNKLHELKEKQ